jgi:predicted membrane protein
MAYFKRTNIFQKIVFSRGMALLILFAVVFVGYGLMSIVNKSIEASSSRKIAESQAFALKAKEANLTNKIEALKTPVGQEASLREQFPVVKAGEHVVVITDDTVNQSQTATAIVSKPSEGGFWNFVKNLFK